MQPARTREAPPVVLVKWYDVVKWLLERVDRFPKNQRFIFGQRIAADALDILAQLVDASYRRDKVNCWRAPTGVWRGTAVAASHGDGS